jgi:hypothetical protein
MFHNRRDGGSVDLSFDGLMAYIYLHGDNRIGYDSISIIVCTLFHLNVRGAPW